jgi:flagellar export protein FliJ
MKQFQFRLESVLRLRRSECDVRRQALAQVVNQDQQLEVTRHETQAAWLAQIDELRQREAGGRDVDVDASVSRRSYVAQLSRELADIDSRRLDLSRQIDLCRQELLRADQAVKSLETLAEQQFAEFRQQQERIEARELEQAWLARNAVQNSACFGVLG